MKNTSPDRKLSVAVVGLEFGAEFVPIYRDHPAVSAVSVADLNDDLLQEVGNRFAVADRFSSLESVLEDDDVDAVHIVTGLHQHADQVVAALDAGKHVACTVPMALTIDDLYRIIEARERSGKNYMMMETAVYTREFLCAQEMMQRGEFGEVRYARGVHYQDMTDWPWYWSGLPPMHYATHAISPILKLLGASPARVRALGVGTGAPESMDAYGNAFVVETGLVELRDSPAVIELARSLFHVARSYTEAFSVYGDVRSFEWAQLEDEEQPVLFEMGASSAEHRGRPITGRRLKVPDRADLLPEGIRKYTTRFVHEDTSDAHLSFVQGGGHGGSHPHLVHEFVSSIVEGRTPAVDEFVAATWTATGIAAHQSAMASGAPVEVPLFARPGGA